MSRRERNLPIEEIAEEKTSVRKTYATVAFGFKTFSPSQIKMSIHAKKSLATLSSVSFVVVLTDYESVTRFSKFPDSNNPPIVVERMRFCPTVPLHYCSCTGQIKHSRGLEVFSSAISSVMRAMPPFLKLASVMSFVSSIGHWLFEPQSTRGVWGFVNVAETAHDFVY